MTRTLYDRIGVGYSVYRHPDARISAQIAAAIGPARSVLNVGAGAGSYEPAGLRVVAVEPSAEMIRQRGAAAAPAVRAVAEHLPFRDRSFAGDARCLVSRPQRTADQPSASRARRPAKGSTTGAFSRTSTSSMSAAPP